MKRILLGLTAVLLTVALAMPAAAAEVQIGGNYGMAFVFSDGLHKKDADVDRFWVHQSSSVAFNFILDEDIKVNFTIGTPNSRWGGETGLKFGGDNSMINMDTNTESGFSSDRRLRLNYSYVDWKFGKTGLSTRVGLQQFRTPGFAAGTPVFHFKAPGVSLGYKAGIADVNFTWLRLGDNGGSAFDADYYNDEFDMFYLGVPVRLEGMTILPWAEYSVVGKNTSMPSFKGTNPPTPANIAAKVAGLNYSKTGGEDWKVWHVGISADMNFGDAFVKADLMYGEAKPDDDFEYTVGAAPAVSKMKEIKGYYAAVKGGYKMDFGTLALTAWYASGNDSDDMKKGKHGTMPSFVSDGDPCFTATSVGAWGMSPQTTAFMITSNGIGTSGIALAVENMSFVQNLFHTARVGYWMGTHEDKAGTATQYMTLRAGGGTGLDESDSAIDLSFDSRYVVSKNATVFFDLGYIIADYDKKGPNQAAAAAKWDKNGYRAGLSLQFRF